MSRSPKNNENVVLDNGRRKFLIGAGLVVAGAALPFGATSLLGCTRYETPSAAAATATPIATLPPTPAPTQNTVSIPWQYVKLDSIAAAERGYTAYYAGGCMFGSFEGIIGGLREKVGSPYNTFPAEMMKYGGAGVSGWGTLCGALNGVAAAIALVSDPKVRNTLINEVFGWYGSTALPDFKPASPKFPNIQTSVADSQLCHVSVSKWCTDSGFKATSSERAERCAWLTASVVKYTVDLLNKQANGALVATFAVPASVTGCLSCHGKDGLGNVHNTNQTSCTNCHTDLGENHPAK